MEENIQKEKNAGRGKNTGMAIIAYILFFIPLLTEFRSDPFVKYHVKQGLVLFLASIVSGVLASIPLLGLVIAPLMSIAFLVLFAIGIINAANGEQKPLPLIGQFAGMFKF